MSGYTSTYLANAYLKLIFQGIAIPNLADNAAISPSTQLSVGLHTADPGVGNSQSTNEANYTGYARIMEGRNNTIWNVTANQVVNIPTMVFPPCTAGSNTITYASIGLSSSGSTVILYAGPVGAPLVVGPGVTPQFAPGQLGFQQL